MTLKNTWNDGDSFSAADQNTVANEVNGKEDLAKKNVASGYCGLDSSGKVAASRIPSISYTSSSITGLPYDLSLVSFSPFSVRAVGTGDNPFGIKIQRNCTLSNVTFRCATADASGNLVVELRKNGVTVVGSSTTLSAANQISGVTQSGTWSFAAGDILTVYVMSVGNTPGAGLVADFLGSC